MIRKKDTRRSQVLSVTENCSIRTSHKLRKAITWSTTENQPTYSLGSRCGPGVKLNTIQIYHYLQLYISQPRHTSKSIPDDCVNANLKTWPQSSPKIYQRQRRLKWNNTLYYIAIEINKLIWLWFWGRREIFPGFLSEQRWGYCSCSEILSLKSALIKLLVVVVVVNIDFC